MTLVNILLIFTALIYHIQESTMDDDDYFWSSGIFKDYKVEILLIVFFFSVSFSFDGFSVLFLLNIILIFITFRIHWQTLQRMTI